jgi:hypothetical protein
MPVLEILKLRTIKEFRKLGSIEGKVMFLFSD